MFRVKSATQVPRAKIMFCAKMMHPENYVTKPSSLVYLIPPLSKAGYETVVSDSLSCLIYSPNSAILFEDRQMQVSMQESRLDLVAQTTQRLLDELSVERPLFLGFSVYDDNAEDVFNIATAIAAADPTVAFVFGGHFISTNPDVSRTHFGSFNNVVLVNGEAELALPLALDGFLSRQSVVSNGIFIKNDSSVLSDTLSTRSFLSQAEHDGLELCLDVLDDQLTHTLTAYNKPGLDLITSRGCFRGCSYCSASSAMRSGFVSWMPAKIQEKVGLVQNWANKKVYGAKLNIGLADDDRLKTPELIKEFCALVKSQQPQRRYSIHLQGAMSNLIDKDGLIRTDLLDAMQGVVGLLNLGGDFWDDEERVRNRGGLEKSLTNEQIRLLISEITKRKIRVKLYWLLGDEQSTITSFAKSALFLHQLYMDFAPYVQIDDPEPVFPYSGTPILKRNLADPKNAGKLLVRSALGSFGQANYFPIYDVLLPSSKILQKVFRDITMITARRGQKFGIGMYLVYLWGFASDWEDKLNIGQKQSLAQIMELLKSGMKMEDILKNSSLVGLLPTTFRFMEQEPRQFELIDLLQACIISRQLPDYYHKGNYDQVVAEEMRRNPTLAALYRGEIDDQCRKIRIRPNDPCSCGSGKKYKKCCGAK